MSEKVRALNGPVPDNLKRILKQKKIKQIELARMLGVPRQRITDIMAGRRLAYPSEIAEIAALLHVTPNALFGLEPVEVRIVSEDDAELIASITQQDVIYKEGYRVEINEDC